MKKTVSQNTTYLTIASVLQKILAFFYFTVIANSIGVEGTGKYFFALSFTTIFVVFIDLGFTNVFIRESARKKGYIAEYLSTLLSFKAGMAVLTYIAATVAVHLLGYDADVRLLVYVSGITMIFDTFHLTLYGALRALGDLRYEGVGMVLSQFFTLILGGIVLFFKLPIVYLILAFTIPSFFNLCFVWYILTQQHGIAVRFKFQKALFFQLAKIAVPFAIAAIFARVYSYIDTILLSKMLSETAVGIYSIPYKITFAFQFIPLALVAALYPKFSELYIINKKQLAQIFEQSMIYLFVVAMPIAMGIFVLASDIITLLYTEAYQASIEPLQILIMSLLFSFISFPIGAFLNACNKQVTQTKIVGFVLLINIILNVLLIPIIGVSGAAVAALVGNSLLSIGGYIFASRIAPIEHMHLLKKAVTIILSGVVMGIIVQLVQTEFEMLPMSVLSGGVVYMAMLFITRTITAEQAKNLVLLLKRT